MTRVSICFGLGVLLLSFTSTASLAQQFHASCDNRSGSVFADVVNTSDPTQSSYNVDPSEIYKSFDLVFFPVSQNSGTTQSSASLTVTSSFLGANPGTHCTGFFAHTEGHASVARGSLTAQASSNDMQSVCFTLSGASPTTPMYFRLMGHQVFTGTGITGSISLSPPSGPAVVISPGTTYNHILKFTVNGDYLLNARFDTGLLSKSSGTGTTFASTATDVSFICPADFDGNNTINVSDIFAFLRSWFAKNPAADSDASGVIDVSDIFTFLRSWFGKCL